MSTSVFHRHLRHLPPTAVGAQGVWITDSSGTRYLDASGDIAPPVITRQVDQALARLPEYDAAIRAYALDRAAQLSEDHDRVKFATRGEGATTEVEAVLPADVIGLYVLVPEAN